MSDTAVTAQSSTYYAVKAVCLSETGKEVTRSLGMVRGMTDNGQPGWTACGDMGFKTAEEARDFVKRPGAFSVYDGHYKGGEITIVRINTEIVKTLTTTIIDKWLP